MQAACSSLASIEGEINQIVYRLFDLTRDEIALIESRLDRTDGTRKSTEGGQADTFFSLLVTNPAKKFPGNKLSRFYHVASDFRRLLTSD